MSDATYARVREIFHEVYAMGPADCARRLDELCAGDESLRRQVDVILRGHAQAEASGGLEPAPLVGASGVNLEEVGGCRIIRVLGEGGMGVVYEAEQQEPHRRVALKVIRPGFVTPSMLSRFRREADVLARLAHPGIAQIYGVGVEESSGVRVPYIIMELVEGESLVRYASAQSLDVRARLQLAISVCEGVDHAHQKGVIHRDLKPGNILVTASGQPKILDFGIARMTESDMQATRHTEIGQLLGTAAYMSPEQASGDPALLDARSDVYAIGVLLYELLTGRLPIEIGSLPLLEAVRAIREDEPTRIGSINTSLRGDVEIITGKALEKDRTRRYPSAGALAEDLRRHLHSQPIEAHAPSALYQLRKFASRHKAFAAAAVITIVAMAVGTATATVGLVQARRQRDVARTEAATAAAVSSFLGDMLGSVDPNIAQGRDVSVASVLDDASTRLDRGELSSEAQVEAQLRTVIGDSYAKLARYDEARDQLSEALAITQRIHGPVSLETAATLDLLGGVETSAGRYDEAERLFREAIAIRGARGVPAHLTADAASLGSVFYWTGRYEQAERWCRDVLEDLDSAGHASDPRIGIALGWLGASLEAQGRLQESIAAHRDAVEAQRASYGAQHTEIAASLNNLANALEASGAYPAARAAHEESLAIKRELLRSDHPDIAASLNNLSIVLIRQGEPDAAEPLLREAIEIRRASLGEEHPSTAVAHSTLGRALMELGRLPEALAELDAAVDLAERSVGADHLMAIVFRASRARCLTQLERYDEAEPILLREREQLVALLGEDHRRVRDVENYLVDLYEQWGRPELAAPWRDQPADRGI